MSSSIKTITSIMHKFITYLARFLRAFSPGLQEYLECVSFLEFLENGTLLTKEKAEADLLKSNAKVHQLFLPNSSKGIPFIITDKDYLSGIADLTGELMRLCINTVPSGNHEFCNKITAFVRFIYDGTELCNSTNMQVFVDCQLQPKMISARRLKSCSRVC